MTTDAIDSKPKGYIAELYVARTRGHKALEAFRAGMGMRKGDSYRWLAKQMQLTEADCHFSTFTLAQCAHAVAILDRALERQERRRG